MTPLRFWLAAGLFHVIVVAAAWLMASRWSDHARCNRPAPRWMATLARDLFALAVFTYAASLLATFGANLGYDEQRVHVGPISLRLLGQALFVEACALGFALAFRHQRAMRLMRASALAVATTALFAANVDAYYVEPAMIVVRHHVAGAAAESVRSIRILHISDIQTPAIGPREERALVTGLAQRPDLIVMTGDYVQDAMGVATERMAAADLRDVVRRIGFTAPLGVFATEGDVGPPCAVVFAGTDVRCLVDGSDRVSLTDGSTLGITGLSRGRGRERVTDRLARILASAPSSDHRIVISHSPDFVDAMPFAVDLVLAGHTHGGQVVIPFFGPPKTAIRLPRRYAGGLNDYRGTPLHVSRGLGMERGFEIPVRFLCPPEICIIELRLPRASSFRNESDS
jgi:predicted MPP superfamily phosphohydrolase